LAETVKDRCVGSRHLDVEEDGIPGRGHGEIEEGATLALPSGQIADGVGQIGIAAEGEPQMPRTDSLRVLQGGGAQRGELFLSDRLFSRWQRAGVGHR